MNRKIKALSLFQRLLGIGLLLAVYSGHSTSKQIFRSTQNVSEAQIFSEQAVHAITQDHNGFIWFGTQQGLNRYDGYSFKTFVHDDYDSTSISAGWIVSIYEDSKKQLWIGTANNGLSLFDRTTQTFSNFSHDPDIPDSLSDDHIHTLFEDSRNNLWIGTNDGLNRYDANRGSFTHYRHNASVDKSLSHNSISAITEDSKGYLWISTNGGGLNRLDPKSGVFEHFAHDPNNTNSPASDYLSALFIDAQDKLWIGSSHNGLSVFATEGQTFRHFRHSSDNVFSLSDDSINAILQDSMGNILIATNRGLNRWLTESERFVIDQQSFSNSPIMSGDRVYSIFQDKAELLWIGTNLGLYKWDLEIKDFSPVSRFRTAKNNLNAYTFNGNAANNNISNRNTFYDNTANKVGSNNQTQYSYSIFSIYENRQGDVWFGTSQGLNLFNPQTKEAKPFLSDLNKNNPFDSKKITALHFDDNNILWAGTKNSGIIRFDTKTEKFELFKHQADDSDSISANSITTIKATADNQLWIGTLTGGLNLFDPQQKSFQRLSNYINSNKVTSVYQESERFVWVGTFGRGLNLLDLKTKNSTTIEYQQENSESLASNNVWAIHRDKRGELWFATHSGLSRLTFRDDKNKIYKFKNYTRSDGLAGNSIVSMLEDEQGDLWLGGNAGLIKFDPIQETATNYALTDNPLGNEFNFGAFFKNIDGKLYFGGVNGITSFYPRQLKANSHIPPVKLTQLLINNTPIKSDKPLQDISSVQLTHEDYLVSFEYSSLDYSSPLKNRYRHKLEGFDNDWIETDTEHSATYTKLPTGNYLFKVMGSNSRGIWNTQGVEIAVSVAPPPWLTWWAYILYAITVVISIYMTIYFRTQKYKRQAEQLNRLVTKRTQTIEALLDNKNMLFTNISHEFRTPLTLILGPVQSILDKTPLDNESRRHLSLVRRSANRLLRMVEQLLDIAKFQEIQTIDKTLQSLDQILKQLILPFKESAESRGIAFEFKIAQPILALIIEDAFEKIALNLISNAIKYSNSGDKIFIELIKTDDNQVKFTVKDSGKGISESQQATIFDRFTRVLDTQSEKIAGAGIGLALVNELVEFHEGSIFLESEIGVGSCFTIYLKGCDENIDSNKQKHIKQFNKQSIELELESLEQRSIATSDNKSIALDKTNIEDKLTKILIIEDNPDMQSYLKSTLQEQYHCVFASNGKQGVELALELVPDLIISDVMMPEMDGFEVSQRIKSEMVTNHIPLILLTARGDRESRLRGWKEFADEYLTKPFDQEELLIRVSNLLSIRSILRKRYNNEYAGAKSCSPKFKPKAVLQHSNSQIEDLDSPEQAFISQLEKEVSKVYQEPKLKIEVIAKNMAMSDRQLNRKIKCILDVTPSEYLRTYRLNKAAALIMQGTNIANAGYSVGFTSHPYFSQCFKAFFGKSPTNFITENEREKPLTSGELNEK